MTNDDLSLLQEPPTRYDTIRAEVSRWEPRPMPKDYRPVKTDPRTCNARHPMTSARCILEAPRAALRNGEPVIVRHRGPHWGPTSTGDLIEWRQEETS